MIHVDRGNWGTNHDLVRMPESIKKTEDRFPSVICLMRTGFLVLTQERLGCFCIFTRAEEDLIIIEKSKCQIRKQFQVRQLSYT